MQGGPFWGDMSHFFFLFFPQNLTVWGQLPLSPTPSRPPSPTPWARPRRHREGPGQEPPENLAMHSPPPPHPRVPLRLGGADSLENSAGFGQGRHGKPRVLSRSLPGVPAPDSPQGGRVGKEGRGQRGRRRPGGKLPAGGRRGGGRWAAAAGAVGLPPSGPGAGGVGWGGGGGTRHTARGPNLRRALGATASPRRGRPEGASDNTTLPSVT